MKTETTVVISPRYNENLPTLYEALPTKGSAEIFVQVFNKTNNIYKAEIREDNNECS